MHYHLCHTTTYNYDRPVALTPHLLRLHPRASGDQSMRQHQLVINPQPLNTSLSLDVAGNTVTQIWFPPEQLITSLAITATTEVITHRQNPFDYILESWAVEFPLDYPASLLSQLQGYLAPLGLAASPDPLVGELAATIQQEVDHNVGLFLTTLTQRIYNRCTYQLRETGQPQVPSITWQNKTGSCRDFTVLFMAACRSVGLATRFVSGYTEGEPKATKYLHAWAEVYLPGGGWRGFDPTLGLVVADRHIPLAAAALPQDATPIAGSLRYPGARSTMTYTLEINAIDPE